MQIVYGLMNKPGTARSGMFTWRWRRHTSIFPLTTLALIASRAFAASPSDENSFPPLVPEGESEAILGVTREEGRPIFSVHRPPHDGVSARADQLQVVYSRDSKLLATTGEDQSIHLWDIATGRELRRLQGHSGSVWSMAFGPDGKTLATFDKDGTIRLSDVTTGLELRRLQGHFDEGDSVAFSPDGKTYATTGKDPSIRLWDITTGRELLTLTGHSDKINRVAFSPDGQTLASASDDQTVGLWDIATGRELRRLKRHTEKVLSVAFSPDGKALASADEGGTIRLWKRPKGREIRHIRGDFDQVSALIFSPDSKSIAGMSGDKTFSIWDSGRGRELHRLHGDQAFVSWLAFSPDGKNLAAASADSTVWVWHRDGKLAMILLAGTHGWAAWRADQPSHRRVLRGDDGNLLARRNEDGSSSPIPPEEGKSPRLTVQTELGRVAQQGIMGEVALEIFNADDASPAIWIVVKARALQPSTSTSSLVFRTPPTVLRLEPGARITLPVEYMRTQRDNPRPGKERVVLVVHHAYDGGKPIEIPTELEFQAPSFSMLTKTPVRKSGELSVPIALYNIGDGATARALSVKARFLLADGQYVDSDFETVYDDGLRPGAIREFSLKLPKHVANAPRFQIHLTLTEHVPLASQQTDFASTWTLQSNWHSARSPGWLYVVGALALLLLGVALYWFRVYRNPAVLAVAKDASWLLRRHLRSLPKDARALARVRRLDKVLADLGISSERFNQVLNVAYEPSKAAEALVFALGGELDPSRTQPPIARLPGLQPPLGPEVAVAVLGGMQVEPGEAQRLSESIRNAGLGGALLIDLTYSENGLHVFANVVDFDGVVLSSADLRDILLAEKPLLTFGQRVAAQQGLTPCPVALDEGVNPFVGRMEELHKLTDGNLPNAVLVGGRQMGKSSLLKAVARRLSTRKNVEVRYLSLSTDDLIGEMAIALDQPRPETIETFQKIIGGSKERPRVWLIDEADKFVKADLAQPLPYCGEVCWALFALAEEGTTYFVLAGFWDLFQAAAFDTGSPIPNLGELVRLGPLAPEATTKLVRQSMKAHGLTVEKDAIARIIEATGCRANLATLVCQGLLKQISREIKTVQLADVEHVLDTDQTLHKELMYWKSEPTERAVGHVALSLTHPTRKAIEARLKAAGISLDDSELDRAFARLELGYVLLHQHEHGVDRWICPVPLIARIEARAMTWDEHLKHDVKAIRLAGATDASKPSEIAQPTSPSRQ
jgi:WD40 repeat protein